MISNQYGKYFESVQLNENISVPSDMHGYSLAIEFAKDWFLEQFENDFFKTVYINGKHVFDDYRTVLNQKKIRVIEKPAVAIIPTIDINFNRENLDLYLGGKNLLIRRSSYNQHGFFSDEENNMFMGTYLKQIKLNFNYRIRVASRAQQIDLVNYMKLAFRIGATQSHYLNLDFHIPYDIMLNIAKDSGFEINDERIVDIYGFLKYLNSHSNVPFLYKFRTVNGRNEFFIKVINAYTHVSCLEELSIDDGERNGALDNNFNIDMNMELKIPVPAIYWYLSKEKLNTKFSQRYTLKGLYSYRSFEPPERNENGWDQYLSTEWYNENEDTYLDTINFTTLLGNERLMRVIRHTKETLISPRVFMDIKLYNDTYEIPITIDWDTYDIIVKKDLPSYITKICIYVDKLYLNEQLIASENLDKSRLEDNGEFNNKR